MNNAYTALEIMSVQSTSTSHFFAKAGSGGQLACRFCGPHGSKTSKYTIDKQFAETALGAHRPIPG